MYPEFITQKLHRIMLQRPPVFRTEVLASPYICKSTSSSRTPHVEMNKNNNTSNGKQEAVSNKAVQKRLSIDSIAFIRNYLGPKSSQQRPNASFITTDNVGSSLSATQKQYSVVGMTQQARMCTSDMSVPCPKQPQCPSVEDTNQETKCYLPSVSSDCSGGEETLKESTSSLDVDCTHMLEVSLPKSFGKLEHSQSRWKKSVKHSLKDGSSNMRKNKKNKSRRPCSPVEVFDICLPEADNSTFPSYSCEFLDEANEPEVDKLNEEPRERILRPGMILLKNYISDIEQVSIVRKCRELGIGPGGFYQPGYKYGAKLRLHMMCLGLDWDPQTRKYQNRRRIDRSKPPDIPYEFHRLVDRAMSDSLALIRREVKVSNAEEILPQMNPDICIVNFYSETGRLGLHQDRDESTESLTKGLPVVSFSVGDSAEFLYGDQRDANQAENLILDSGDVLIFGGQSRHVFHSVTSIIPSSAPHFLLEETGLKPGRLNLTFRQY